MPKLIAITRVGNYPQGNITPEMLTEMVNSYSKDLQSAPFITEHRSFNEKGELINNLRAIGWINTLTTDGTFLYALPEETNDLAWYFDGISYRYASIEIEVKEINRKPTLYCAAVAVTNFPAANIPIIEFNRNTQGSRLIAAYNQITLTNNNEEEMNELLIKLCKELGLPEGSSEAVVFAKLTEMKSLEPKQTTSVTTSVDEGAITKLTESVNALAAKFEAMDNTSLSGEIDKAIADGKFLPAQRELLLQQYANNTTGFKAFADVSPKIQLNATLTIPKAPNGSPLTYNDLLRDAKLFEQTQKDNPVLFGQLKSDWLKNPSSKKNEA